jgi:hypothetical protein
VLAGDSAAHVGLGLVQLAHDREGRCTAWRGRSLSVGGVSTRLDVVGVAHNPAGKRDAESAPERE